MELHTNEHLLEVGVTTVGGKRIRKKQNESKSMCPQCGRLFQCSGNLSKHIRRVHLKQRLFSCDLCK